jgi:hypothetical protein
LSDLTYLGSREDCNKLFAYETVSHVCKSGVKRLVKNLFSDFNKVTNSFTLVIFKRDKSIPNTAILYVFFVVYFVLYVKEFVVNFEPFKTHVLETS